MSISITDSTSKCFEGDDVACKILAPLTFASTLIPALLSLYSLLKEQHKGPVSKLIGILYGEFMIQGVILLKYAQGADSNNDGKPDNDRILFYTGLIILIFNAIAFSVDFLKKYTIFTSGWKVYRILCGSIICAATVVIGVLDFPFFYDVLYALCLAWALVCTLTMGVIIVVALIKKSRREVPYWLFVSCAAVYALWNATIWTFLINDDAVFDNDTIPIVSVLLVAFLLHFGYCVAYRMIDDMERDNGSYYLPELGYKFGVNVRDETDVDSSQSSPKKDP